MKTSTQINKYIKWDKFYNNPNLSWQTISRIKQSEEFLEEFHDNLFWPYISAYQKLSYDFLIKYQYLIQWSWYGLTRNYSDEFLTNTNSKINWNRILKTQQVGSTFLDKFEPCFNTKEIWDTISQFQNLDDYYILNHKDKLNLTLILQAQKLSFELRKFITQYSKKEIS